MVSEFAKLVVIPVALVMFLAAAQDAADLSWRGSQPVEVAAVR